MVNASPEKSIVARKTVLFTAMCCSFMLLGSFTCLGQGSDRTASLNLIRKHSLELYSSPFSKATPVRGQTFQKGEYGDYMDWYKNSSQTGLKYGYAFHHRFSLKIGLGHHVYRLGSYDYYAPAGSNEPSRVSKSSVHALMFNFGMNVRLFGRAKFRSYICFGGTVLQYLQRVDHNTFKFPDGTTSNNTEKSKVSNSDIKPVIGTLGLRFEYQISRHFMLSFEPNATYGSIAIRRFSYPNSTPKIVSKIELYYPVGIAYCF